MACGYFRNPYRVNRLALFRNSTTRVSISKVVPFLLSLRLKSPLWYPWPPGPSRTIAFAHPFCPAAHRMMRPVREAAPRLGFVRLYLYFRERLPLAREHLGRSAPFHPSRSLSGSFVLLRGLMRIIIAYRFEYLNNWALSIRFIH